jgi:RNA recognition motif-containing protein
MAFNALSQHTFNDPIMKALMTRTISWADVPEDKDRPYPTNEQLEMFKRIQFEIELLKTNPPSPILSATNSPISSQTSEYDSDYDSESELDYSINLNSIKTLVLRNLPRDITSDELSSYFSKYGTILNIYIPKNMDKNSPYYGTIKGFALIKYSSSESSTNAYLKESKLFVLRGKTIVFDFAKEDR